ncbi:MAG: NADH-ubiquinone oxidoreductase-F iron-sulfur binding region domain-containing protein [Pseudomonadota bacterium]|nr:NADH-ubiquinone oxidoreductase-F iron-sulfur binding region domain-containing protein [Pseudomonadota bacterium]
MSTQEILLSRDSVAAALGADGLMDPLGKMGQLTTTGSLGATWAEPLVQVRADGTIQRYAQVRSAQLKQPTSEIDAWLDAQTRLVFGRSGLVAPTDLVAYQKDGGFSNVDRDPKQIIEAVKLSGLRGRGGAGFPAHIKWRTVADTPAEQKYIVCNADEGDSGTFADRMIMEGDPFLLIDAMLLAGQAVGADRAFIYLRSEYPLAIEVMSEALRLSREHNLLGEHFDIELFIGAGAYICGEETSLLESLEGKRGQIRAKPPLPAISGLHGKPTLVHNVITLCSVPWIVRHGGDAYRQYGIGDSTGTMPFQLSGNVRKGGLIELPFGMRLGDFLDEYSGGTRSGGPIKGVQIGGPLGAYLNPKQFGTPLTYEDMQKIGAGIGHGGIVVYDGQIDMAQQAQYAFEFCAIESCGKCTPCRIGSVRGAELMQNLRSGRAEDIEAELIKLQDLCEVLEKTSLCQMGGMTPIPVNSAITNFPDDFVFGRSET